MTSVVTTKVPSVVIPQFDSFDRIVQALGVIDAHGALSEDTIDLSHRHVNYCGSVAARSFVKRSATRCRTKPRPAMVASRL